MKKLSEYQEEYMFIRNRNQRGIGVACDKCGHELQGDRSILLLTDPPKISVWCDECNFKGYMNV